MKYKAELSLLLFTLGAFCVFARVSPSLGIVAGSACGVASLLLLSFLAARRRRLAYRSGNAELAFEAAREEGSEPELKAALGALAVASAGDTTFARRLLLAAPRHVSEEARELGLCARIVVEALEGDHARSLQFCEELAAFPREGESCPERRRARRLGSLAVARASAGCAEAADLEMLREASVIEPMMYWLCRYTAALHCVRKNAPEIAHRLVEKAPSWPDSSAFRLLELRISA